MESIQQNALPYTDASAARHAGADAFSHTDANAPTYADAARQIPADPSLGFGGNPLESQTADPGAGAGPCAPDLPGTPGNASPTNASSTNTSSTNTSSTNASSTNASSTNTSPTNASSTNTSSTKTSEETLEALKAAHREEMDQLRIQGEVRYMLARMGAKNPALAAKGVDLSGVTVDAAGVAGVEEAVGRLMESDPYLFGIRPVQPMSTGEGASGGVHGERRRDPMDMSDKEYYAMVLGQRRS